MSQDKEIFTGNKNKEIYNVFHTNVSLGKYVKKLTPLLGVIFRVKEVFKKHFPNHGFHFKVLLTRSCLVVTGLRSLDYLGMCYPRAGFLINRKTA